MWVYKIKGMKASSEAFINVKEDMWSQMLSKDNEVRKIRDLVESGMQTAE